MFVVYGSLPFRNFKATVYIIFFLRNICVEIVDISNSNRYAKTKPAFFIILSKNCFTKKLFLNNFSALKVLYVYVTTTQQTMIAYVRVAFKPLRSIAKIAFSLLAK